MNDFILMVAVVFIGLIASRILEAFGKLFLSNVVLERLVLSFGVYCYILIEPFVSFKPLLSLF